MVDLLRTDKTYATRDGALKALERAVKKAGAESSAGIPGLIAVNADGRYAPVVVGIQYLCLAHHGVTVVGG